MGIHVDISPTKADGSWKTGEECFLEAYKEFGKLSQTKSTSIFANQNTNPKALAESLIESYGADWVKWLPETIREQLAKDYGEVPEEIIQKIFAIKVLLSNDDFWKDPYIFQNIILAFNNVYPDFGFFQDISPAQIVFGILEARKIREFEFGEVIKAYIRNSLYDHGLFAPPQQLDFLGLDMISGISYNGKDATDEETFEGIQSAKLNAIDIYVKEMQNAKLSK